MASLDDFLRDVLPDCPGVPGPTAERALRHALREFCEHSLAVRADLAAINVLADTRDYALSAPAGTEIVLPIYVQYDGAPIFPASEAYLDQRLPYWRVNGTAGLRYQFTLPATLTLTFDPAANITGGLVVRVATRPTLTTDTVADALLRWVEGIAHGAKARLLAQPGKDWTDLKAAAISSAHFRNAIAAARFAAEQSNTSQEPQVTIPAIAMGCQRR